MDRWNRTAIWGAAATAIFATAHVADELWGRWDAGSSVTSSAVASLMGGATMGLVLLAFAGTLLAKRWGFGLAVVLGAFAVYSGGTHVFAQDGMDSVRWAVVALEVLSGLALMAAAGREFVVVRGAGRTRPIGG